MEIDLIRAEKIAKLNDKCRKWFVNIYGKSHNSQLLLTRTLCEEIRRNNLPLYDLLLFIRSYSDFNEGNDPYKERDFWKFRFDTLEVIRKIDYYDLNLEYHSPDPADEEKTVRVMTVMLASDR